MQNGTPASSSRCGTLKAAAYRPGSQRRQRQSVDTGVDDRPSTPCPPSSARDAPARHPEGADDRPRGPGAAAWRKPGRRLDLRAASSAWMNTAAPCAPETVADHRLPAQSRWRVDLVPGLAGCLFGSEVRPGIVEGVLNPALPRCSSARLAQRSPPPPSPRSDPTSELRAPPSVAS